MIDRFGPAFPLDAFRIRWRALCETAFSLKVDLEQCVALEDSEAGILSASRAGMVPLLIPEGEPRWCTACSLGGT